MLLRHWFVSILIMGISFSPALWGQEGDKVIARVAHEYITETEFLQRYELFPAAKRSVNGSADEAKLIFLYSLIAEKILQQKGDQMGLRNDSIFNRSTLELRGMLARDQLYRREVKQRIEISDSMLQNALKRASELRRVTFMYCEDSSDAQFISRVNRDLKKGQALLFDTEMKILTDTATVTWNEAHPLIEDAAFNTREGELSQPIRIGKGYYILRVDTITRNGDFLGMTSQAKIQAVREGIAAREEERLMNKVMQEHLAGKQISFNNHRILRLAELIMAEYTSKDLGTPLTQENVENIRRTLGHEGTQEAIRAGEQSFSMVDLAVQLYRISFAPGSMEQRSIAHSIVEYSKYMAWQSHLEQIGLAMKLDEDPSVISSLRMWNSHHMAEYVKSRLRTGLRRTLEAQTRGAVDEAFLQSKYRRALTELVATGAEELGYEIYYDRLKKIEVSTIPMISFRKLGFGGRMFTVPPVQQLIDWLELQRESTVPLP